MEVELKEVISYAFDNDIRAGRNVRFDRAGFLGDHVVSFVFCANPKFPLAQIGFPVTAPRFHSPKINIARLLSSEPWSSYSYRVYSEGGADSGIQSGATRSWPHLQSLLAVPSYSSSDTTPEPML